MHQVEIVDRGASWRVVSDRVCRHTRRGVVKVVSREPGAVHGGSGLSASLGRRLLRQAAAKEWVVYSKAPMAGPQQVLRYLGRYTHRIAIGNERLLALQDGTVSFAIVIGAKQTPHE